MDTNSKIFLVTLNRELTKSLIDSNAWRLIQAKTTCSIQLDEFQRSELTIPKGEYQDLLEILHDEIVATGFDKNYEKNFMGDKLDGIIGLIERKFIE